MAMTLNPYISFQGQARDAMTFYQSVFGGQLDINTFGDFGMEGLPADQVMHSRLATDDGFTLMGADTPDGMSYTKGDDITISLTGDDAKLRTFFDALAEGGTVTMPLEKQIWGDHFGQLTDKFGIHWMVNIADSAAEQG